MQLHEICTIHFDLSLLFTLYTGFVFFWFDTNTFMRHSIFLRIKTKKLTRRKEKKRKEYTMTYFYVTKNMTRITTCSSRALTFERIVLIANAARC